MLKVYVLLVPLFRAYGALLYTNPGHNVTLPCFYASSAKHLCWYKQVAGEQPQIMSSFYKHLPNSNSFHNQFKGNARFSVHTGEGFYHLNISNVQDLDSAMYYCGQTKITVTEFDNGTFLFLKESSRRPFLQQPLSDSVKPGASVTLNCSLHTGTSDGAHSVYWFKTHSRDLGIMYIHTHSSRECVQSLEPDSPAQSCVYSLPKRNVSLSDAGTYYCAVASCGEVLFGKGTRLDVGEKKDDIFPVLMPGVVAALLASVILNVILISILCKMARSIGLHPQTSIQEYTADSQNEEPDSLPYVALDFKKRQSRRQRSTKEETIYSGVRLTDLK
ncbi:polymeric immunoglobulin receptor-like [Enoplosus armatus]|uniref:polymeric immunoglobulin receptor-like n=1 Tax=Enoplosus armatus TaxID=215367 RepID=UPI003994AAA7